MKFLRLFLIPFGLLYLSITNFRNWLFKKNIKRSLSFSLPIINVGNLSMGGTGKTPHVELLVRQFLGKNQIATLSRGYGRKVYGFQIANSESSAISLGDEPFQFYKKFGIDITVAVDADRVNGVSEICLQKPDIDLIILDDAYQHRSIKPGLNILLTDYSHPFFKDYILPVGTLRESKKGKNRADIIIVTKCPDNISETTKKNYIQHINPSSTQNVFFSHVKYGVFKSLTNFNKSEITTESIILVTGIARAEALLNHLSKSFKIIKHFNFTDHYKFRENDIEEIHNLLVKFADDFPVIITTEKDAMRLLNEPLKSKIESKPWFYQEIEVELDNQIAFDQIVQKYVQENSRDY